VQVNTIKKIVTKSETIV